MGKNDLTFKETLKEFDETKLPLIKLLVAIPAYLTIDAEKFQGTFARLPERNELPKDINEAQIIEYYNRKL